MTKSPEKESIKITLAKDEVLTDYYDNGGDATELDDVSTEQEIVIQSKTTNK